MDSYTSMKTKLLPTGLYSFAEGSETERELKAYAAGLDEVFRQLDEIEREAFIVTAESYGLSNREVFIDSVKPDLPVEERRDFLLASEQNGGGDATAEGFKAYLGKCGITNYTVREAPSRQRVQIFINDDLTEGQKSLVRKKISQAVPAHLTVSVHYHDGTTDTY